MDGARPDKLPVQPQPVRQQIEDQLRGAIISGAFAPGSHLSDRSLCEQFGVSRSIIREAVRLMEAEGLVTVIPYRGPFVAFLSAAEAAEVYEVRGVLEALAGQGFAERASDHERAELRQIYEELSVAGPGAGRAALLELKRRFYDVLLRGSRNAYVGRMLGHLLNRDAQLRATSLSDPGRLPQTVRELRRIVEAVERRDPDGAWRACREHVAAAAAVALRIIRQREADAQEALSEARRKR